VTMKISVYITSYNQKQYLIEAIDSVLDQTLRPFQIIIVDDCSTDGSQEVIAGYASMYPDLVTPIYHAQNKGVAQSRIDALQAVTGDYVSRVDGDDRFLPTKLEKEAKSLLDHPDAQIAFSDHYFMTVDGIHTGVWAGKESPPQGYVFRQTFARDFPRHALFKRDLVNYQAWMKVGFYDPNLKIYEDYDMCIRLTKHLQVVYYNEPLSETRMHRSGLSSAKAAEHLAAIEYIYRKNKPLLDELRASERRHVERNVGRWMAWLAMKVAYEAVRDGPNQRGGRARVFKYYLQCLKYQPRYFLNYKAILRILFPHNIHGWLREISHMGNLEE
jgi:glycosyltransferase involved in cell wall biosynthesis